MSTVFCSASSGRTTGIAKSFSVESCVMTLVGSSSVSSAGSGGLMRRARRGLSCFTLGFALAGGGGAGGAGGAGAGTGSTIRMPLSGGGATLAATLLESAGGAGGGSTLCSAGAGSALAMRTVSGGVAPGVPIPGTPNCSSKITPWSNSEASKPPNRRRPARSATGARWGAAPNFMQPKP